MSKKIIFAILLAMLLAPLGMEAKKFCSKAAGTLFQSRRNVCPRPWDGRGILCLFKNSASYGTTQAQSPALDLWSLTTEGTQKRASRPQAGVQPLWGWD